MKEKQPSAISSQPSANEPETAEQWQEAVDAAEFFLAMDSARQYGLVETDVRVDVERCVELLRRGKARGIEPASLDKLCERFLKGTAA